MVDGVLEEFVSVIEGSEILRWFSTGLLSSTSSLDATLDCSDSFAWAFLCCSKVALTENFIPHKSHVYDPVTSVKIKKKIEWEAGRHVHESETNRSRQKWAKNLAILRKLRFSVKNTAPSFP